MLKRQSTLRSKLEKPTPLANNDGLSAIVSNKVSQTDKLVLKALNSYITENDYHIEAYPSF